MIIHLRSCCSNLKYWQQPAVGVGEKVKFDRQCCISRSLILWECWHLLLRKVYYLPFLPFHDNCAPWKTGVIWTAPHRMMKESMSQTCLKYVAALSWPVLKMWNLSWKPSTTFNEETAKLSDLNFLFSSGKPCLFAFVCFHAGTFPTFLSFFPLIRKVLLRERVSWLWSPKRVLDRYPGYKIQILIYTKGGFLYQYPVFSEWHPVLEVI